MNRPSQQSTRRRQNKTPLFSLALPTRRQKYLLVVIVVLLAAWTVFLATMAVMF